MIGFKSTATMDAMKSKNGWSTFLEGEFKKPYFEALLAFVGEQRKVAEVYPPDPLVFAAFDLCPLDELKVVILGQDPYHGAGQATGLAFSVPKGVRLPPSLKNIYKELHADLSVPIPAHGSLEGWAKQGVLLLNTTLTVRKGEPLSHAKRGWEEFTEKALAYIAGLSRPVVFILWGNAAKQKYKDALEHHGLISRDNHLVIAAGHPSPFSARLFLGSRPFSQTNFFLKSQGLSAIDFTKVD